MMKKERTGRKAHDTEDAVKSLRKHALDFSADETGGGQIEIGKRQHVALDAAFLFFVESHDHEHGDERGRHGGYGRQGSLLRLPGVREEEKERQPENGPAGKRK